MDRERLHGGIHISEFIISLRKELIEEIKSLDGKQNIDLENEKEKLNSKYKLGPLKLGDPIPSEPRRERRIAKNDWGNTCEFDVHRMEIYLPFEGNGDLFYCKPSTWAMVYPEIDSINNRSRKIIFTIYLTELTGDNYKNAINEVVADLNKNIPHVNNDVSSWDLSLKDLIDSEFNKFENFLSQKNSFYENIGLKITPQADKYITPSPITRKTIPKPKLEETESIKKIHPKLYKTCL